jgi:hypothetical protein
MTSTYCLIIEGALPTSAHDALRRRFGDVRVQTAGSRSLIECSVTDQPGLRGLLAQVWDVGAVVLVLAAVPGSTDQELP